MTGFVAFLVAVNLLFAVRGFILARRPYERVTAREVSSGLPALSIVVPARDEERQIEECVRSLLAQRHNDFEVVVVDDCSGDATPHILERLSAQDPRLRVVSGAPLPGGWVGKPWALAQGVREARGSWLLFTDADTFHYPDGAASVQQAAIERNLGVLSVLTDQDLVTLPERALMPSLFLAILGGTGPIGDVGDPEKPDVALFNGQYIMASRPAYEAIGGHGAVRNEIAEDLELARRFKRDGRFRIALTGSDGVAHTRMYRSLGEIWRGFTKNFALGLRERPVWGAIGALTLACISPLTQLTFIAALLMGRWIDAAALAVAMSLVLTVAAFQMRLMRVPVSSIPWYPAGTAFTVAVLGASIALFASGRGVVWRGRRYGRSG
ncbi:MAG TPA: glycosyltransferase family 2 protein [Candidatus Baltobacteraceae bacterium]|nr:glycosyltransferase family 2 protein [Candidatus Baltobacteraceae bacterium]